MVGLTRQFLGEQRGRLNMAFVGKNFDSFGDLRIGC